MEDRRWAFYKYITMKRPRQSCMNGGHGVHWCLPGRNKTQNGCYHPFMSLEFKWKETEKAALDGWRLLLLMLLFGMERQAGIMGLPSVARWSQNGVGGGRLMEGRRRRAFVIYIFSACALINPHEVRENKL